MWFRGLKKHTINENWILNGATIKAVSKAWKGIGTAKPMRQTDKASLMYHFLLSFFNEHVRTRFPLLFIVLLKMSKKSVPKSNDVPSKVHQIRTVKKLQIIYKVGIYEKENSFARRSVLVKLITKYSDCWPDSCNVL